MKFEPSSEEFAKPHEVCTFSQHAFCASPRMRNFTYDSRSENFTFLVKDMFQANLSTDDCGCDPSCLSVHFSVENIVYGSWRNPLMKKKPNISVGSFMITGAAVKKANQQIYLQKFSTRGE